MEEIWKDIKGFEGEYQISNKGRVKSLPKLCGRWHKPETIRTLSLTRDGYPKISLLAGNKDVTTRVHRLVAAAFLGPSDLTVNHKDGNKLNNCVENLEYADRHEQLYHAYKLGLKKPLRDFSNPHAKLTKEQVLYIREHYIKGDKTYGGSALGRKFGVTERVISLVANRKSYKEV